MVSREWPYSPLLIHKFFPHAEIVVIFLQSLETLENQNTSSHKIFFSYSRADGEQRALKLANDLRSAGADVWIDQLDIEAGKLWDLEVEKALNAANCVLFIATEKSTTSNNVLDEVYYALEEGKAVIPLCFHECRIPFRLQRLQRIDFTTDYETAFRRLLKTLDLNYSEERPSASEQTAQKEVINEESSGKWLMPKLENKKAESLRKIFDPAETETKKSRRSGKVIAWGISMAAVATILFFLIRNITGEKKPDVLAAKQETLQQTANDTAANVAKAASSQALPKRDSPAKTINQPAEHKQTSTTNNNQPQKDEPKPDKNTTGNEAATPGGNPQVTQPIKSQQLNTKALQEVSQLVPQASTSVIIQHVKVKVQIDENDKIQNKKAFTYFLAGRPAELNQIQEVRYKRNYRAVPEFEGNNFLSSATRGNNFSLKVYQAGRINTVFLTLVFKDGTMSESALKDVIFE
jgi:hypothetical protein